MVNQLRTLLLNSDGDTVIPDWTIGEEFVPESYVAPNVDLFKTIRARLFGTSPDRSYMNIRLAQYMRVLHSSELVDFVTQVDPRITYIDSDRTDIYGTANFTPSVVTPSGITPLTIQGTPNSPDATGLSYNSYVITVIDGATVQVTSDHPTSKNWFLDYSIVDGSTSTLLPLGDSGYKLFLPEAPTNTQWRVSFHNRPQRDIGQILADTHIVGEPALLALFGASPVEPYLTFSNLYNKNLELPYQLGGLLLALAYKTNEIRKGVNG